MPAREDDANLTAECLLDIEATPNYCWKAEGLWGLASNGNLVQAEPPSNRKPDEQPESDVWPEIVLAYVALAEMLRRFDSTPNPLRERLDLAIRNEANPPRKPAVNDLSEEVAFFEAHKAQLLTAFRGQYVAIKGKEVLGHDNDRTKLVKSVFSRYGVQSVLIRQVSDEPRRIHFRSPKRHQRVL